MELIIGAGILGIVALAVVTFMDYVSVISITSKVKTAQGSLMVTFRQDVADINVLRKSLKQPENIAFYACVCGNGGSCTSNQYVPLSLYQQGDVAPVADTKYFDVNGSPCTRTDPNCYFQVQTQFVGQCLPVMPATNPMPPANCTGGAELVGVSFSLQANPALVVNGTIRGNVIPTTQGVAYTMVSDLAPSGSGVCP